MYAIVRSGGKQYRVQSGQTVYLERIEGKVGDTVTLGEVLLVAGGDGPARLGSPLLEKATVVAKVVEQGRDRKVRVFKYKQRKHYRRTRGHRQSYTALRIESIEL